MGAASLGGGVALAGIFPDWARAASPGIAPALPTVLGNEIRSTIGHTALTVDGRSGHAVAINGTVPGPLLRLK